MGCCAVIILYDVCRGRLYVLRVQLSHGKGKRTNVEGKEGEKLHDIFPHIHQRQMEWPQSGVDLKSMRSFEECQHYCE